MARRQAPDDAMTILIRGLFKECPRCGQGHLFRRWLRMSETCPRCGLRFEREEGAFLGSLTLNYGVTGAVFFVVLIGWLVIGGSEHINWLALGLASLGVITIVPLAFYPFAKTIWAAIDYLIYRNDPTYGQHGPSAGEDERSGT